VYVTVSSYFVPVLVVADEFVLLIAGALPQLISTISMSTNYGCI